MRIFILASLIAIGMSSIARGDEAASHVRTRFLADVSAISAGKPFMVGVEFKIDPGWHVYWKNPGDAGSPTRIQFLVPEGFSVSELQFPVPQKLEQPGNIVEYGYENSVLLTAVVTPPDKLPVDFVGHFTAEVSWLVCQDVCIPGKAKLEMTLVGSQSPAGANEELFRQWTSQVPVEASRSAGVESVDCTGRVDENGGAGGGEFVLSIRWKSAAPKVFAAIPGSVDAYKISGISIEPNGDGNVTTIKFAARLLSGQKAVPATLEWVIGYIDKDGGHRSIATSVSLPDARKK